jgi:hypothetical protein
VHDPGPDRVNVGREVIDEVVLRQPGEALLVGEQIPVYWFLVQIGMIAGFFTSWPVNTWLIRAGIKEAM